MKTKKSQSAARHITLLIVLLLIFAVAMAIVIWQSKDVMLAWFGRITNIGFG